MNSNTKLIRPLSLALVAYLCWPGAVFADGRDGDPPPPQEPSDHVNQDNSAPEAPPLLPPIDFAPYLNWKKPDNVPPSSPPTPANRPKIGEPAPGDPAANEPNDPDGLGDAEPRGKKAPAPLLEPPAYLWPMSVSYTPPAYFRYFLITPLPPAVKPLPQSAYRVYTPFRRSPWQLRYRDQMRNRIRRR